jgi:hypothetical protein
MQLNITFTPDAPGGQKGCVGLSNGNSFRAVRKLRERAVLFFSLEQEGAYAGCKLKLAKAPDAYLSGSAGAVRSQLDQLRSANRLTQSRYEELLREIDGRSSDAGVKVVPLHDHFPVASSISYIDLELDAELKAEYITSVQREKTGRVRYAYRDHTGKMAYGRMTALQPGYTLTECVRRVCADITPDLLPEALDGPLSRIVALYKQVVATYRDLFRDHSILPFDLSSGNILASYDADQAGGDPSDWRWRAIDFADHLDNRNGVHGLVKRQTDKSPETEKQLSGIRQRSNQRFFYALHKMLVRSLRAVYRKAGVDEDHQQLITRLGEDFNPDLIPSDSSSRSTAALFNYFDRVLVELYPVQAADAVIQVVDPAPFTAEDVLWGKALKMRESLHQVSEHLSRHADVAQLRCKIDNFIGQIPGAKPNALEAVRLYGQGLRVVADLAKEDKILEHRYGAAYRGRGAKSVLTMTHGQRAAIVFAGGVVIGLLALLVMYLFAKYKSGSQKLIDGLMNSLVSLRVVKARQVEATAEAAAAAAAAGPRREVALSDRSHVSTLVQSDRGGGGGGASADADTAAPGMVRD